MNENQSRFSNSSIIYRIAPAPLRKVAGRIYRCRHDLQDAMAACVGRIPSHKVRLIFYRTLCRITIGSHSSVHLGCRFYFPRSVCIGNNTVINRRVLLDGRYPLTIGNNCSISEEAMLLTLEHDPDSPSFENRGGPIVVKDRVFIGTRAIILPGVTLGEGAVVAASAVVTRDVDPFAIVAGVPARFLRQRSRELAYQLDYRKLFS